MIKSLASAAIKFALIFTIAFSSLACGNSKSDVSNNPPLKSISNSQPFKFTKIVSQEGIKEKATKLAADIMTGTMKKGPDFYLTSMPVDEGMALLNHLGDYFSKRYDDQKIRSEFLATKTLFPSDSIPFLVMIGGSQGTNYNASLALDKKAFEFFFLENEKGEFVKASSQQFDNEYNTNVTYVNAVVMMVYFPKADVDKLMTTSKELYLTFKGLNISNDNKIKIQYPFDLYYSKEFPEINSMVKEIES